MSTGPVWKVDTPDLYWVPRRAKIARDLRAGMPEIANYVVEHVQIFADDDTEDANTALSTKNAAYDVDVSSGNVTLAFRYSIAQTNAAFNQGPEFWSAEMYVDVNGGGYTLVGVGLAIADTGSSHETDGNDTTERLAGSYAFITDNNWVTVSSDASGNCTFPDGQTAEAELLFYGRVIAANVSNGDVVTLRPYDNTTNSPLNGYTNDIVLNITKTTTVQGSGTATGSADATGTADVTHNADGTATGSAEATATGRIVVSGSGTATGSAEASGTATVTHNNSGTATGTGYASATSTVTHRNSGTATGSAEATGTAMLVVRGVATATGSADATGTATVTHGADATVTGQGYATGTADVTHRNSGTATGSAEATATATVTEGTKYGEGTATGTAFASAVATVKHFALATAAGAAFVTATGTVTHSAVASVTGSAEATATASVTHSASGTATGDAEATGTAQVTHNASGTATGRAYASATAVQETAHGEITGNAYASATATLYLPTNSGTVTGRAYAEATGSTAIKGDGTATGSADVSATGTVGHSAVGTATGTAFAGGDASVTHNPTATATGQAYAEATGKITQQGAGTATGTAYASATATVVHNASGTATGQGFAEATGTAVGQATEGIATGKAYVSGTGTVQYRGLGTATGKAYTSGTLTAGDFSASGTATGRAYAWAGELPGWSYIAYLDDGIWFRLAKYSPLYGIQVIESVYYEHEPNVYYNIVLEADGNALNAKVWSDAESEPAWMIQETDTEHVSGSPGMVALSTTEVLFDVFSTGIGGDPYPLGRLPGAPTWLQPDPPVYLTRSDPVLTLEWTQPEMTGDVMGGQVAYELEYQRDGDTAWTNFWRGYERTYDWDMSRLPAGSYCVRVRAYVGCEYGPWAELCGISFEGKAPTFETPDGYYFGDDNVGQPDHGMWIRLFQASHLDDEFPVNACLVSRELIPAGVGGECLFKKLYVTFTYTTAATVQITPILDGKVLTEEMRTIQLDLAGDRVVDRFEVDLTRGYDDAGVEQFRYGMRGTYFQVKICVVDTGGTGRVEIDGVAVKYLVARETHAWARPFTGELEVDVTLEREGGYYFGTETEDVPAAIWKHGDQLDFGLNLTPLIQPRAVAPFGTSEEAWFRSLYLCVTRSNQTAWDLEVVPILDGVELTAETVTLDAVTQPKTEVFEIPLSRPYELTDIERSRYGIRGVWFTYRIRTVSRRPVGEITFDGAALEAIPCRETEAGS